MKPFLFLLLTLSVLLCACNKNNRPPVLSRSNLKSSFINLDAAAAYTLKTARGAIIKIEQNSFKINGNTKLQLEIKEAYSMQDILLAGLSTESNGNLLKSGGMIYINATAGSEQVELLKPIKISIPTEVYDSSMQLFKGEIKDDSSINWVDPEPIDTSAFAKRLLWGKRLFKSNCASCHKPAMDYTGPSLERVRDRATDRDWAYRFITGPSKMISEGDPYAKKLYRQWRGNGMMSNFPTLSRNAVNAILDYCDNEAKLNPRDTLEKGNDIAAVPVSVPCGYDTVYYPKPDTDSSINIVTADGPDLKMIQFDDTDKLNPSTDTTDILTDNLNNPFLQNNSISRRGPLNFTDMGITSGRYDIAISAFGWYNLDVFVKNYPGVKSVNLKVQLQMEQEMEMHVYLFCPEKKLLTEAFALGEGKYDFIDAEKNGLPLFMNDQAVLLAFGSKADKMYYGTASFKIKSAQNISIKIAETTTEQLQSFIKNNKIDGIKIDLSKKDNFEVQPRPCDTVYPDRAPKPAKQ
jgi:mono/diheme cytochrome c family protein